jgi:hypothetical protein
MHLGIGLLMNMYAFAAIMLVLNVAAFGWPYVTFWQQYWFKKNGLPYFRTNILPE